VTAPESILTTVVASDDDSLVKLSPHVLCEQPDGDYWGNREKETEIYFTRAWRIMDWIAQYPSAAARLRVVVVRCPEKGCQLAEVYRFELAPKPDPSPRPGGRMSRGERFVAVSKLRSGKVGGGFCNWAFSDGWAGAAHWFPAGCRHGGAKLNRHWLLECVGAIHVWKHELETEGDFLRKLPREQAKGRRRGVFHPPANMWMPKR
jgi:hypothetical protein